MQLGLRSITMKSSFVMNILYLGTLGHGPFKAMVGGIHSYSIHTPCRHCTWLAGGFHSRGRVHRVTEDGELGQLEAHKSSHLSMQFKYERMRPQ